MTLRSDARDAVERRPKIHSTPICCSPLRVEVGKRRAGLSRPHEGAPEAVAVLSYPAVTMQFENVVSSLEVPSIKDKLKLDYYST
jgi:hypothetical protein